MSSSKRRCMPTPQSPVSKAVGIHRLGAHMWHPGAHAPPAMPSDSPQVDLAVVEVGIGGAYDCTNIVR